MSNKITGISGQVVNPSERAAPQGREAKAGRPARTEKADDSVRLTSAAQELRAATESLAGVPAADPQRIAAVKSSIERGEYRPDPAKIAGQLLKMEDQI
jgi:negative regulator of flagellin synthesis FlgM